MLARHFRNLLTFISVAIVVSALGCSTEEEPTPIPTPSLPPTPTARQAPASSVSGPALGPTPAIALGAPEASAPPPMTINPSEDYKATIHMEKGGEIVMQLFPQEAPVTVNSFVFLARDGYYDGVTFHRVMDFKAESGDPTGTGQGGPGYTFDDEFSPKRRHDRPGVLSRTSGTSGSQFFIALIPFSSLDGLNPDGSSKDCGELHRIGNVVKPVTCHTVFGRVIEGMDVVNSISPRDPQTATTPGDAIRTITIEEGE